MLQCYLCMLETEHDKSKFTELYEEYRQMMFSVALNYLKNLHLAEDVVHEAFLAVVDLLQDIESIHSKKTRNLLFTITKNKALNVMKHETVKSNQLHQLVDLSQQEILQDSLEQQEIILQLSHLVLQLPEREQLVLRLQYGNEYPFDKIASILELSPEAVRTLSSRARKKIKKQFSEKEWFE